MPNMESAKYCYATDLGGLPLLKASFHKQCFSRHVHEGYCIGVIEQGAQRFFRSGANHIASQNCIILVNADQIHDGQTATDQGWKYRAMYPLPDLLQQVQTEVLPGKTGSVLFKQPVVSDLMMANQLRHLFTVLDNSTNRLQRESVFHHTMATLLQRHGQFGFEFQPLSKDDQVVGRIQEYLDAHFAQNVSTADLAQLVGLNPFYLTRLFTQQVGMPPHAYQVQRRLQHAKRLLDEGDELIEVAHNSGFSDQSHLTRHFKRWLGVTPGQFRKHRWAS